MLDRAAESSPNTPKYRRSEKGQKIPSQSGLDGRGRAPYTHRNPEGGGGARTQRGLPPAGSPVEVWGGGGNERGHRGRGPHPSHNREEGAESAGSDWKQMGPPCQAQRHPIPERGLREGGEGGAAPPRQPIPAGAAAPCGLKTPRERQGTRRPSSSWELGKAVSEGQGPPAETQGPPQWGGGGVIPPSNPIPRELGSVPPSMHREGSQSQHSLVFQTLLPLPSPTISRPRFPKRLGRKREKREITKVRKSWDSNSSLGPETQRPDP